MLDITHQPMLGRTHKRNRLTLFTSTARAANTMHVIFSHHRELKINDVWEFLDIDATGSNISRYQNPSCTAFKLLQSFGTLRLTLIAVHRNRWQSVIGQSARELVRTKFCFGENQYLMHVV